MEPQLVEAVIRPGLARYEFRHFIIFGSTSEFAALATECAGDQGAWWEFHDAYLLEALASSYTRSGALRLAEREGLDEAQFAQCLDSEEHLARIEAMQRDGLNMGVRGTPTFFINGEPAARSVDGMIRQVEQAAEAARQSAGE